MRDSNVYYKTVFLQELLIEVYRSIGEPDSLYGCGGETMTSPLTRWSISRLKRPAGLLIFFHITYFVMLFYRIRTYEHEAMWGKALTSYDLHATLPEVTRQVGIVEVHC